MATESQQASQTAAKAIWEAVKRTPGMLVGGGVDAANLALGLLSGKGFDGLVSKPVGGGEWINEFFGLNQSKDALQQGTEAALSMLSPGGVAKAIIVPAFAIKKLGDVRKAEKLINTGKVNEAWSQHGIYQDPADQMLKAVLPDTGAKLSPAASLSGKLEIQPAGFKNQEPWYGPAQADKYSKPVGTVQEFLIHPDLYKLVPELANIGIRRDPLRLQGAAYYPYDNRIDMGLQKGEKNFLSVLLHELQHGVQTKFGMAEGGSYSQFFKDEAQFNKARKTISDAQKATRRDLTDPGRLPDSILNILARYRGQLNAAEEQAIKNYYRLPGETEARAVEQMFTNPSTLTQNPLTLMTQELAQRYGAGTTRELNPSALPQVDVSPEIKAILDNVDILYEGVLRGWAKP